MEDIYENTGEYNLNKNCKILTVFDDIIARVINKKIDPIVT